VPESEGPDTEEPCLAERDLARIPDEEILSLDADGVDKDNGGDIRDMFRYKPGEEEETKDKQSHPDPCPCLSNELKFFLVAFNQVHAGGSVLVTGYWIIGFIEFVGFIGFMEFAEL